MLMPELSAPFTFSITVLALFAFFVSSILMLASSALLMFMSSVLIPGSSLLFLI